MSCLLCKNTGLVLGPNISNCKCPVCPDREVGVWRPTLHLGQVASPPGLTITTEDHANFGCDEIFRLTGEAHSEEGNISANIVWTAEDAKPIQLGTGEAVLTSLSGGDWIISARITDRNGGVATETITVSILDEPGITLPKDDDSKVQTRHSSLAPKIPKGPATV